MLRRESNSSSRGRPSNLAFLELADGERADMAARYKAIGGEQSEDSQLENSLAQKPSKDSLTMLQDQVDKLTLDELSAEREKVRKYLAGKKAAELAASEAPSKSVPSDANVKASKTLDATEEAVQAKTAASKDVEIEMPAEEIEQIVEEVSEEH